MRQGSGIWACLGLTGAWTWVAPQAEQGDEWPEETASTTPTCCAGLKAPSTLGTFLRSFRWGHVRQLDRVSRELLARAWAAGAGPGDGPLTIDLDSTICETYGLVKEGARHHSYTGQRGYHPLLAVAAGTGDVLMARLREGRANTARGSAHFLRETVGRVRYGGARGQLTVGSIPTWSPLREICVGCQTRGAHTHRRRIDLQCGCWCSRCGAKPQPTIAGLDSSGYGNALPAALETVAIAVHLQNMRMAEGTAYLLHGRCCTLRPCAVSQPKVGSYGRAAASTVDAENFTRPPGMAPDEAGRNAHTASNTLTATLVDINRSGSFVSGETITL